MRDKTAALKVNKDGNQWFVSCGGCLAHPTGKFAFGETLEQAVRKWNSRTSVHPITLEKAMTLFLQEISITKPRLNLVNMQTMIAGKINWCSIGQVDTVTKM